MLLYVLTASINEVRNLNPLNSLDQKDLKVLIVDAGNAKLRMKNNEHPKDFPKYI